MKKIPLTKGKFALVDDEDYDFLMQWKWHINNWGYALRNTMLPNKKRTKLWMHRIVNNTPDGLETDHINGDALDNQKHNLRAVTRTQNECNKPARKNKSSKYKGVTWLKALKKWQAKIKIGGTKISLGYFPPDQEIQAALAYNVAALKYHGEFAHLNSLDAVLSE